MIRRILAKLVLCLLKLRYRIHVRGLEEVLARGNRGILFLPNHPALIDPVILTGILLPRFAARPLADARQIDRPLLRHLARWVGVRALPDAGRDGSASIEQIQKALTDTIDGLQRGENALIYPAGHLAHARHEDLGGNSAVETLLRNVPDLRVVVVRTKGLWGSSFSYATSSQLHVGRILWKGFLALLANGLFFGPRRCVKIEFSEPADLPRTADRATLNRYLERLYNRDASANTYVPYTLWERGAVRELPDPPRHGGHDASLSHVPATTRQIVADHLAEASGLPANTLRDEMRLANDLGLDSLARVDLALWIEKEFGFRQAEGDSLQTVADAMLAACGEAISRSGETVKPPHPRWFVDRPAANRVTIPEGDTLTSVFLRQAALGPDRAAVADATSGVKTYRDLVTAILALQPALQALPGEYLGILLPASVGADILFLATLFAGKTPVMVNWTVGRRAMLHSLDLLNVRHVLTSRALVARLETEGMDLDGLKERFLPLEDLRKRITPTQKALAALRSRLSWRTLRKATPPTNAVVLFTSGSESLPKAVPLTHANILTNIRDTVASIALYADDRVLGIAPPFHSMGLTATMALPLCAGFKVVHSPNPMAGALLANLVQAYRVTVAVGTPTFLGGITRAAMPGQLSTLRLAVTGAEACPASVTSALARHCRGARVLEAYGVTECSPLVSLNRYNDPRPGTIGRMLPSVQWAVVDVNTGRAVPAGGAGMLLVRGPSIFGGYLNYDGPSPFVDFQGQQWYRTGDLVQYDADGVFTFAGRLKRFVKLGGEMISLPAIETVLAEHAAPSADGPTLAVEATSTDHHPEIVLFTTNGIPREQANALLRKAGLSPLHNIRRVVPVDAIPVLGTGKTDYRKLQEMLVETCPV